MKSRLFASVPTEEERPERLLPPAHPCHHIVQPLLARLLAPVDPALLSSRCCRLAEPGPAADGEAFGEEQTTRFSQLNDRVQRTRTQRVLPKRSVGSSKD